MQFLKTLNIYASLTKHNHIILYRMVHIASSYHTVPYQIIRLGHFVVHPWTPLTPQVLDLATIMLWPLAVRTYVYVYPYPWFFESPPFDTRCLKITVLHRFRLPVLQSSESQMGNSVQYRLICLQHQQTTVNLALCEVRAGPYILRQSSDPTLTSAQSQTLRVRVGSDDYLLFNNQLPQFPNLSSYEPLL